MRGLLLVLIAVSVASSQANNPAYPYLLRLEHSNSDGHACTLLQNTGAFHLEIDHGDQTKVFEGTIDTNELLRIERDLNNDLPVNLSQQQIEEPLIRARHDEVQVTVLRTDGWQDLYFRSSDSQQPFERWLQPLVHWLDSLHKLPHRELSEDEGKNHCLPPKVIALKRRDADSHPKSLTPETATRVLSAGAAPQALPSPTTTPQSVPALLRLYLSEVKTDSAHENCVLIAENGKYRFEDRAQKTGKPVNTQIMGGQITPEELRQLRQLLEDPALSKIKHREPPGGMVVPMMGDMLNIFISRPAGVQEFILSSRFNHPGFAWFYGGDADISNARPLLKFLTEHIESNKAGVLHPVSCNRCSEAP